MKQLRKQKSLSLKSIFQEHTPHVKDERLPTVAETKDISPLMGIFDNQSYKLSSGVRNRKVFTFQEFTNFNPNSMSSPNRRHRNQHINTQESNLPSQSTIGRLPSLTVHTLKSENTVINETKKKLEHFVESRKEIAFQQHQQYIETKNLINDGKLTSRKLQKFLKPQKEKLSTNMTNETGRILTLAQQIRQGIPANNIPDNQKLKIANYVLNVKKNVHKKYQEVESLLTEMYYQATRNKEQDLQNLKFLSGIQGQFLKRKKMKEQQRQHDELNRLIENIN